VSVRDLLNILEFGKNISQQDSMKRYSISKYVWWKLNKEGVSSKSLGYNKNKKGDEQAQKDIVIPPRPFFMRAALSFISANRSKNNTFDIGDYCLNISVTKK
jgi:hypothetical protein